MLIALAGAQAATQPVPAFPALSSAGFQKNVRSIEAALSKGDAAGAKAIAERLPKRSITLTYDDHLVPAAQRDEFRAAVNRAVAAWRLVRVVPGAKGDLKIAFSDRIAPDAQTGVPGNVATFFGQDPDEPAVSAFIGLHRGSPLRDANVRDVVNDVTYSIGAYLGLTRHSISAGAMYNSSLNDDLRGVLRPELKAAATNLILADRLRAAAAAGTSLTVTGVGRAAVDVSGFEGKALQGDIVDVEIPITNSGDGPLTVDAEGDCGCVVPEVIPPIAPGKSSVLKVGIQTREFATPIERKITVFTNDPDRPIAVLPVKIGITPRFRFIVRGGSSVTLQEGKNVVDAYMTFPEGHEMEVTKVSALPTDIKATFERWSGTLADPEHGEAAIPRKGYHFRVEVPSDKVASGRSLVNVVVFTKEPAFENLYQTFSVQRGIVALPGELFLGEVPAGSVKTATILLTRPGKPFTVKSAKAASDTYSVKVEPGKSTGEIKLVVTYNGRGFGDIGTKITVVTDDPKQPKLVIPVVGTSQ